MSTPFQGFKLIAEPIQFSQGDTSTFQLTAVDGDGDPVDLTDAAFSTQILGPNGVGPITFPDDQHTLIDAENGVFSLALSSDDTGQCGEGANKQIVSQILIGSVLNYFHGVNLLTVLPSEPVQ